MALQSSAVSDAAALPSGEGMRGAIRERPERKRRERALDEARVAHQDQVATGVPMRRQARGDIALRRAGDEQVAVRGAACQGG